MSPRQLETYHNWLTELTSLPTAAGHEDRVIAWIEKWVNRRKCCVMSSDRYGNLIIERDSAGAKRRTKQAKSKRGKSAKEPPPIYFTAHMDHPAFVVTEIHGTRELVADFRGGVRAEFFDGAKVRWHGDVGDSASAPGRIDGKPAITSAGDKQVRVRFRRAIDARAGDVLSWDLPAARIRGDRLRAPACDDLAALAAAIAAFDQLNRGKVTPDVRLLFTRSEEVGFVGAIGACKARTVPRDALLIALENSKSFAESPIGGGPIVRVGDRTSTFDPDLTYRIDRLAAALAGEDESFKYQRKLMPGGTCEASAFQAFGHRATCLCLPLGNYHNMNEDKGRIDSEFISVSDFDNLVKLLVAIGRKLGDEDQSPSLKSRLEKLFDGRKGLLS